MAGHLYHWRKYVRFSRQEVVGLLLTALTAGFVLSFRHWGGVTPDVRVGAQNFVFTVIATFCLLGWHVGAQKVAGVYYGLKVGYDKYALGLLVGLFVSFLTFGLVPFFITGHLSYEAITTLRTGRFRGTLPKKWEITLTAAAGPLASVLIMIPLSALFMATGFEAFRSLIGVSALIGVFSLLPLPLIGTANPYAVYMSRLESLEGNVPGYDIFWGSPSWYFFFAGLVLFFSVVAYFFRASWLLLVIAVLLGLGLMYVYGKTVAEHEHW